MRKLKKIFITSIFIFISFVTLITIFAFNTNVYASNEINVEDTSNASQFSEYLNLVKEGTYYSEFTISTFENTDVYQNCKEINEKYPNKTIKKNNISPNIKNFGFKVNGEFYATSYQIENSGTYNISVCSKITKNNEIKAGTIFETFKIYVDLNYEINLFKTKFYVENYNTPAFNNFMTDLMNSINKNDNEIIYINNQTELQNLFFSVSSSKNNEKVMVEFKKDNFIYKTEIEICSLENIPNEEKDNFSKSKDEFLKNIYEDLKLSSNGELYCALAYENLNSFKDTFYQYLNNRIVKNDAQYIDILIDTKELNNINSITSTKYVKKNIIVTLSSNSLNEDINFYVTCVIYNLENVLKSTKKYRFDFINLLKEEYEFNDSPQNVLNNINLKYIEIGVEDGTNNRYKDFSFLNQITPFLDKEKNSSINDAGKWQSIGEKELSIDLFLNFYNEDYSDIVKKNIMVKNENKIKILTKYNVILLKNLNDTNISDQIKVISKNQDLEYEIKYTFDTEKQVCIIVATNDNNSITKIISYQIIDNYNDNWWLSFLYKYKKFLTNIF